MHNNRINETQDLLFKEMKRIDATENIDNASAKLEFNRAKALYNMSSCLIKTVNTNIAIMKLEKTTGTKYDKIIKKLGL